MTLSEMTLSIRTLCKTLHNYTQQNYHRKITLSETTRSIIILSTVTDTQHNKTQYLELGIRTIKIKTLSITLLSSSNVILSPLC